MNRRSATISCLVFALVIQQANQAQAEYDPLNTSVNIEIIDTSFTYGATNRSVPLRLYLPNTGSPAPVILFSHGLGGSREASPFLGNQWSARGYCVVFMQHTGSDREEIKNAPRFQRLQALKNAMSRESVINRNNDVRATLDQLEELNLSRGRYCNRFDLEKVGMSGHSFGAITTQAVSGQNYGSQGQIYTDSRIKAAIAMSPSMPSSGRTPTTFSMVKIPWLLMTGTADDSPVNRRVDAKSRRDVFKSLPSNGNSFELVLNEGTHFIFGGRSEKLFGPQSPQQQQASIKAISTGFWDAYLKQDPEAKAWLKGESVRTVLDPRDVWSIK